jgi:TatA/E family protein of Tat protein translocase
MGELLTPTHLIVVLVIALLLFGPRKLPELGTGLGEGLRGFKDAINPERGQVKVIRVKPLVELRWRRARLLLMPTPSPGFDLPSSAPSRTRQPK